MNVAGRRVTPLTVFLFALGLFFAAGVFAFVEQGIVEQGVKVLAVPAPIAAVLVFAAGGLRL